jgi:hypothetical protein
VLLKKNALGDYGHAEYAGLMAVSHDCEVLSTIGSCDWYDWIP